WTLSAGQSEYGAALTYNVTHPLNPQNGAQTTNAYVCMSNLTSDNYFIPKNSASELQTLMNLGSWVACANKGGTCSFSGTKNVRYGNSQYGWTVTTANGSIPCNYANFPAPPSTAGVSICSGDICVSSYANVCQYNNLPPNLHIY